MTGRARKRKAAGSDQSALMTNFLTEDQLRVCGVRTTPPEMREAAASAAGLLCLLPRDERSRAQEQLRKVVFGRGISVRDSNRRKKWLDRWRQWDAAVRHVPTHAKGVRGFVETIRAYESAAIDGHFVSLDDAALKDLPAAVEIMVRASADPEGYVEAVKGMWCEYPSRVFSERTFEKVAKRLRGVFGRLAMQESTAPRDDDLRGVRVVD